MDDFDQKTPWQRWRGRLIALVVVVLVVLAVWQFAGHQVGVRRSAPRIATITPLPPPPPPPKEKPPEPKKVEETKQEIAKPNEPVKPVEAPKQAPDSPKQITIDGPAQAGNDSFNIGAGDGGGMVGSGGGTAWVAALTTNTSATNCSRRSSVTSARAGWCSTCKPIYGSARTASSAASCFRVPVARRPSIRR